MSSYPFSDAEVEQIALIAHEEFADDDDWSVSSVERRLGQQDVVDVKIENVLDHRRLTIPICCEDFPGGYFPNESELTDAVFDVSIRLLEFRGIRGFDEFEDEAIVPLLELYSEGRNHPFDDLPPLQPGNTRHLISPFHTEEEGDVPQ